MSRVAVVVFLVACHRTPPPVESRGACPGPYTIERGTCQHEPPTNCQGLCGYVLRRHGCKPVQHANVAPLVNGSTRAASTDADGRFDLVGIAPGHYTLRVMAEQDDARIELDVATGPQPLATPLELTLLDRSCACGGACVN